MEYCESHKKESLNNIIGTNRKFQKLNTNRGLI
jgi:hypothetical protein